MQKINLERVCKIPAVILSLAQGAIYHHHLRTTDGKELGTNEIKYGDCP